MHRRRRLNPKADANFYIDTGGDKVGLDIKYINAFKGHGIFTSALFEKGDFLLEYRGELISQQECERRQRLHHDCLKVFMFEFHFNGKLWCFDAAKEDGSLGRLVNDNNVNPNAKMKYLNIQGKPHLCLFATRDISQGEEVTYNYGDSDWPWRCKKSEGKSSDGEHGEGPSTSEPSQSTQKVSTNDNSELIESALRDETDQLETSVDGLNPTFTQLGLLNWVEEFVLASILRRVTNDNQHPSQFLECMSDEECTPDSETQDDDDDDYDDDDDSDASIPITPHQLKPGRIQVKPVLPDAGASHGSDTSIPVVKRSPNSSNHFQCC